MYCELLVDTNKFSCIIVTNPVIMNEWNFRNYKLSDYFIRHKIAKL